MVSLSSNLANDLADGIHKIKCKWRHDNEQCETSGTKYKGCEFK